MFRRSYQPLHEAAQNTRNCVHGLGLPGRAPSMFVVHFQFFLSGIRATTLAAVPLVVVGWDAVSVKQQA